MDEDRRDLAIGLRQTLCDWFRTVQLYRMGPGISDQQMEKVWQEIGNHFANLRSWYVKPFGNFIEFSLK